MLGGVAIVTGANSGVGRSVTELLLAAGAEVTLVCRHEARGEHAITEIKRAQPGANATLELADLSCPDSVRNLASRLNSRLRQVDILINNAGLVVERPQTTEDGFELTFATSHIGHFLLTNLLFDCLRGSGCIVNVSSTAHRFGNLRRAPLEDIARGQAWNGAFQAYNDSKLANVLFTMELARRWNNHGIVANALHPGVLSTNIWNRGHNRKGLFLRTVTALMRRADVGGSAILQLTKNSMSGRFSGRYFKATSGTFNPTTRLRECRPQPQAEDRNLASDLWQQSLVWTGLI